MSARMNDFRCKSYPSLVRERERVKGYYGASGLSELVGPIPTAREL